MFKSEGEMAIAISKNRVFEVDGWILKFDPLCKEGCDSPFICRQSITGPWYEMKATWREYASVKEIFPDLEAIKSCVVNYLIGKDGIDDKEVDEILEMGNDSFWIEDSDEEQTRGFHPRHELSICVDVDPFRIEKQGDVYLAVQ